MAEYLIQDTTLTAIADAIRAKTGGTDMISPENMPTKIEGIESNAIAALPVRFVWFNAWGQRGYGSNGSSYTINRSISIAKGATIEYSYAASNSNGSRSSTGADETMVPFEFLDSYSSMWYMNPLTSMYTDKDTTNTNHDTYTFTRLYHSNGMSSTKYRVFADVIMAIFTVPGVTYKINAEGKMDITFDETAPIWHESMVFKIVPGSIGKLDLSNSNYTSIENGDFYGWVYDEIILPPTITSIYPYTLDYHINLSFATSVPLLKKTSGTIKDGFKISVPSALYDAFLADTAWAAYADYIVAV